jgi:ankyrin repeat protein
MNIRRITLQLAILLVLPSLSHAEDLPECELELLSAVLSSDLTVLENGLKGGWDPNCINSNGDSLLYLAAGLTYVKPEVTKLLLQYDADPKFMNEHQMNPLHNPAYYTNLRDKKFDDKNPNYLKLRSLVLNGANPDQPDADGVTPRQMNKYVFRQIDREMRMLGRYKKPVKISL